MRPLRLVKITELGIEQAYERKTTGYSSPNNLVYFFLRKSSSLFHYFCLFIINKFDESFGQKEQKTRAYHSTSANFKLQRRQKRTTLVEMGRRTPKATHRVETAKEPYIVHECEYSKVVPVHAMKM